MQEAADMELLRQYVHRNSDEAFAALVARHVNLVYSAALRKTGNPHAAEEITQAVFIILGKKAGGLREQTILSGWLYQTARLTAANFLRTEIRRARREQEAYMQSLANETEPEIWPQIAPLLEDAMGWLGEKDRDAIALRFFEGKSFQEIGTAVGASENAAKKRVGHALEKLRRYFSKRGVALTAAAIAGAISANSVQAAPPVLAKTATAIALAKGVAAGGSTLTLAQGALKAMGWAKYKFALGLAAGVLVVGGTIALAVADKGVDSGQPDPVALLKRVAAAREKIKSGEMEFQLARHDFQWAIKTNYSLLKVVFDGERRRFEQLQRESYIISMEPDAGKIVEAKRLELGGDDDALARLGLIQFQNAHYRAIYDGKAITRFDPRVHTEIRDPKEGSFTYLFDPRIFGLSDALFPFDTTESCLAYQKAQSVSLIGKENVDDIAAWHVRVQVADTWRYEFWLDVNHPTHVVKQEAPNRGCMVMSKFDERHPEDPLPLELHFVNHYGGDPRPWETWMVRGNTRYNVPIDPKAWTLAGLGMAIGTEVVDARIQRVIGYWAGSNLSKDFPRHAPGRADKPASIMENNLESIAKVKTDGSFVNERKIVLNRAVMVAGCLIFIFVIAAVIKRLVAKSR